MPVGDGVRYAISPAIQQHHLRHRPASTNEQHPIAHDERVVPVARAASKVRYAAQATWWRVRLILLGFRLESAPGADLKLAREGGEQ
jgi:hypothetical protein